MDRRMFLCGLTLGTLAVPPAAEWQQAPNVPTSIESSRSKARRPAGRATHEVRAAGDSENRIAGLDQRGQPLRAEEKDQR